MLLKTVAPTHDLAEWLLKNIDGLLNRMGLSHHDIIEEIIYVIIISLVSIAIGIVLKKFILFITNKIVAVRKTQVTAELLNSKVFVKCAHIIPPLVFMALVPFAFDSGSPVLKWILRIVGVYALIAFAVGLNSILKFIFDQYNDRDNQKNHPLKGILNVATGVVWIVISILSICIIIDKSPGTLLAGLGAFAAALMLIFKDSILGFVAGIQMNDNDMLRVGDWIIVPGTAANGTVLDMSLSTVKIQNWDLSTVMVPPYTLVSTSFQNYRSMYQINCRRILNSLIIAQTSIRTITPDEVDAIVAKYPILNAFVSNLRSQNAKVQSSPVMNAVNGSIETNLGLYRAYVGVYLAQNENISQQQQILVRLMEGTNAGIPLQIYCFTATSNWGEYEGIQSAILEHLSAVAADFAELKIYSVNMVSVDDSPLDRGPMAPQQTVFHANNNGESLTLSPDKDKPAGTAN